MEEVREINFYGTKDLNGFTYTISLPFKLNNTVREISRRIFDLGGKISFTISSKTINIVEEIQTRDIIQMLQIHKDLDKAYYFSNGQLEKITLQKAESYNLLNGANCDQDKIQSHDAKERNDSDNVNDKSLRIINFKDLTKQIEKLEKYSINNHYKAGLPTKVDLNGLISVVIPHKRGTVTELHYHQFEKIKKYNSENYYDIPRYHKEVPSNFSTFLTVYEKKHIIHYVNKISKSRESDAKASLSLSQDSDLMQPRPHRTNLHCTVCNKHYEDYLQHINSAEHRGFTDKVRTLYDKINSSFQKVRKFWESKGVINKNKILFNNPDIEMKSTEVIYDVNKSMLSSNNNLFLFNSIHQDINKIKLEFIQDDERNDELPKEDSCPFICEDVDVVVDAKDFDSPYIDFAIKGLTTEMTKTTSNSNEEIKKKKIKKIFQTYKEKKTLPCKGRSKKADSFLFPSNLRITRSNIKTIMQSNQAMKSFIRFQTKNDDFLKSTLTSREFLNKNKLHF